MSKTADEVKLEPYNIEWRVWFEQLESLLRQNISEKDIIEIVHFGSTAIEEMWAKPRIDVLIICRKGSMQSIINQLSLMGYNHIGNLEVEGRECFKLKDKQLEKQLPTHNLYASEVGTPEIDKIMKFRNNLRKYEHLRKEYIELKTRLMELYPNDVNKYALGKSEFVNKVLALK